MLKDRDRRQYDRTFIVYYLPGMRVCAGGWATSHFEPTLQVRILGLTPAEEQALTSPVVAEANTEIIGSWLDDRPYVGARITILRRHGKTYLETRYKTEALANARSWTVQRVATIVEDIEHIRREWYREVQGDTLRRGSVILRRFVVEDDLGKAWRTCGFERQPMIPAVDLDRHLAEIKDPVLGAIAGGGSVEGVQFAVAFGARGRAPERDERDSDDPNTKEFGLREFGESTGVAAGDARINRLLKYGDGAVAAG